MPMERAMNRTPPARRAPRGRARWAVLATASALVAALLSGPAAAQVPSGPPTVEPAGPPAGGAPAVDHGTPEEQLRAEQILEDTLALAPTTVPASPDDRFVAVVDARQVLSDAGMARLRAVAASSDADRVALQALTAVAHARKVTQAATAKRDASRAWLADERARMAQLIVSAYVNGTDTDEQHLAAVIRGDSTDPAAGRRVLFAQVLARQQEVTDQARATLSADRKGLSVARRKLSLARAVSAQRNATAVARGQEKARAIAAHEQAKSELDTAITRLRSGSVTSLVPEGVAIIGIPRLDAADLAGWFATSPYRPRVTTPIADYATWFIDEGAAEGIRGDIAFAQAVLETGGFANDDSVVANNFSGIGHCDLCPSGWVFPSPRTGVRAQIQLLKSYAVRKPDYVYDLVDKRLHGPPGCCETWGDLTTVWATDPGYGPKVMLIYTSMVDYALRRRAAGQGFDDPRIGVPAP